MTPFEQYKFEMTEKFRRNCIVVGSPMHPVDKDELHKIYEHYHKNYPHAYGFTDLGPEFGRGYRDNDNEVSLYRLFRNRDSSFDNMKTDCAVWYIGTP
jgi:hypothetical protein